MNNFTKEELQGLKNVLLQSREDYPAMHSDQELTVTLNKIQSLIDNYCEHDQGYEQDSCMVDICKKCKEIF